MKKILVFILLLLFASISYSQVTTTLSNNKLFYIYTPVNVGATVSTDQIIFSGASTKTKSDKVDGSKRAYQRWMRYWIDSTNVIANGTFDNSTGWNLVTTPIGAFTIGSGVLSFDSVAFGGAIGGFGRGVLLPNTRYKISFSISAAAGSRARLLFQRGLVNGVGSPAFLTPYNNWRYFVTGDTSIIVTTTSAGWITGRYLTIIPESSGSFDFDDYSVVALADSTSGYQKVLSSLAEDTPYFYSQSGQYLTATDTIYAFAETDTAYSPINEVNFQYVTGSSTGVLTHWINDSYSEVGYEVSYKESTGDNEWTVYDTSAIDAETMSVTGLSTGSYNFRIRTIGDYSNSDYSPTWLTTVTCDLPDTISVLSATGGVGNVTLTWTDVTCDSVYIYRGTSTNPTAFLIAVNNGVQTYVDEAVTQGTIYYYRLRAYENICGSLGIFSATVFDTVLITDETAPSAPTDIDAFNITKITPPEPADTIPTMSNFANVTGAGLSSYNQGFTVLSNLDSCWVNISASDSMKKGALGTYNTSGFKGYPGDTIYTAITASGSYSTATTNTVTAGGVQATYSVTTLADPAWNGTIWYVDRDATGANTGRSWADAWTNLDSAGNYARLGNGGINWNIIGDDDSIYVSDGTYTGQWVTNNNEPVGFSEQVTVARAWQEGHNGTVTFNETSTVTNVDIPVFATRYISNVKFYGFTFIDNRTIPDINWNYVCRSQYDSLVTLDHCRIIGKGTGGLFDITDNSDKITITHSILENLYNENIYDDQDIINVSAGRGGHTFTNNLMILRNDKLGHEDGGHRDGIQLSNYGSSENLQDVIANNIIIDMIPHTSGQTGLIYSYQGYSGGGNRRLLIYNNIIVSRMLGEMNVITAGADNESAAYSLSTRIFNNTIICKGGNTGQKTTPIVIFRQDTIVVKNNLIISDTTNNAFMNLDDYHDGQHWFPDLNYNDIDFNIYSQIMGSNANFYYEGFSREWVDFVSDGFETNGDTVNWNGVSFTNKYDTLATGYYTTTGRDLGTDLTSEIPAFDILGNSRDVGSWDMGALEYQGGGLSEVIWKRLQPFIRNDETDFWKGQK